MKKVPVCYYTKSRFPRKYKEDFEEWEKSAFYCPNCGRDTVWGRNNDTDFYMGDLFLCLNCSHEFTFWGTEDKSKDDQTKQRIKKLKK